MLKLDPKNTELLSQKQTVLKESIEETENKLKLLQSTYQRAVEAEVNGAKISEENWRNLQREIINTQNKLSNLKNEASNWTKVGEKLTQWGENLNKIASKVDSLGSKLTTSLTVPIAGAMTIATKQAIEFESAFTGVTKTVDGTEEQLENLKQGIKDLSKEIPSTTTEISQVAEAAGQLGIQTDNVLAFTKTMINMGNATNLSADEAATTLARFANITKMSQSNFDRLGSVIVALGNNFATTEAEISAMGMNLASAGTQVGMSQSQIMALATALSSVGLEAQAGGTAFSKVMVNMQLAVEKGGNDLKNFASVAGMTTKEFKKAFKEDATGAIMQFVDGLSKSGERGKSAIKILDDMGITETRLRDALLRSANASEIMGKAVQLGNEAWNENNALVNEANKRYNTTESQLIMAKNKINNIAVSLGSKLLPSVNKILDKADKWIEKLDKLSDEQKDNIVKIGLMVAAAGPLLKVGSSAIEITGNVVKGLGTFSKAISLAHNGIGDATGSAATLAKVFQGLFSPVGLAAAGITAAVTAIVIAIKSAEEETKKSLENVGKGASDFISGINSANSHLEAFNSTLFASAEEQQKLQEDMDKVQKGITEICQRASEERRDYTQKEITQLDEYFNKLRELKNRELEIQQSISNAITQQAEQNSKTFQGTLEEYKVQSQEWIKTSEEQANREISIINERTTQEIALLQQRYGEKATLENEEYAREFNLIQDNKNKAIEEANSKVAQVNQIYANGYAERAKQDNEFLTVVQKYNSQAEEENNRHNEEMQEIQEKYGNIENVYRHQKEASNSLHQKAMKNIWNDMYKNMSEEQEKEMGIWLAYVAQTEMYGGKIDDETKNMVDNIISSYDKMPNETREAMRNAMTPMLEEMQNKQPSLFAKASGIADGILSRLKKSFDIHSPSRETRDIFQNVMKGAELGLEDEERRLNKQVESITDKLKTDFSSMIPNMSQIKQSVIDQTRTIFTTPQRVFNVQELDEARLQQCFNYVNRKFGSAY